MTGRKTWISRLTEAAVFVLFFRAPDGHLAAAAVDATDPGLHRQSIPPTGLVGWNWGVLDLDAVQVRQEDVLHGDGMPPRRPTESAPPTPLPRNSRYCSARPGSARTARPPRLAGT
ncbi:hypothetical protein [Lentzea atacamensis]|uniref:hypothetical protein n=1 Tax=Lentzea atacamensis TaxID=531938 RepID=UPI0011B4236D